MSLKTEWEKPGQCILQSLLGSATLVHATTQMIANSDEQFTSVQTESSAIAMETS